MIFFFISPAVVSCEDEEIPYLATLKQNHFNSSQYTASCMSGYALKNKAETFTCKDQQWTPALKCFEKETDAASSQPLSSTTSAGSINGSDSCTKCGHLYTKL